MAPNSASSSSSQRETLACLSCRKSKRACDGASPFNSITTSTKSKRGASSDAPPEATLSENPCSRCIKAKTDCLWLPSQRYGRPKVPAQKKSPSPGTSNPTSTSSNSNSSSKNQPNFHEAVEDLISTLNPPSNQDQDQFSNFDFQNSTFARTANAFTDQASLLAQNGSLDQEIDAGALDECLYNMWGSETDYNKWRTAGGPAASTSSNGVSLTASSMGHGFNNNNDPLNSLTDLSPSAAPSPVGGSAKEQFNMLMAALAPEPQSDQASNQVHTSPLSVQEIITLPNQILAIPDHLRSGCEMFFDLGAQFCPILGNASQFYASSSSQDLFLLTSMAAIGTHLSRACSNPQQNPHLIEARRLADEVISGERALPSIHGGNISYAHSTLSLIQALVIQIFMEYGLADEERASRVLKKAVTLAFESGLHQIDQPQNFAFGSSSLPLQSICTSETQNGDPSKRWLDESLRRTFWEMFLQDILLFCATSGKIGGCIEKNQPGIHVSFNADPGEELLVAPRRDICSMRIRAGESFETPKSQLENDVSSTPRKKMLYRSSWSKLNQTLPLTLYNLHLQTLQATLLLESVLPFETVGGVVENRDQNLSALSRVYSMDLMISNLTVSAHHSFVRAVTVNAQSESLDPEVLRTNRTRVENPFITLLMLNCARIHLHRMFAIPDMNLELTTCSFNPVSKVPTFLERSKLASSLEKIISASESIMSLTRTDYYLHSNLSEGLGSLDIGDDMEELRGIRSRTRNKSLFEKKANFLSPLFAHQPAFACAQLTACWSLVCSIAALRQNVFGPQNGLPISSAAQAEYRESVLWKQRRAISNITFAENNLEISASLWPVSGLMLEEVRRCRETVDSGGLV